MERLREFCKLVKQKETKEEFKQVLTLAWPVSLLCFFELFLQFVTLIFCGHLEKEVFAGVCLAVSYINVTAVSIGNGLGTAVDTLVSQTFGARRIGTVLR